MSEQIILKFPDLEEIRKIIAEEIRGNLPKQNNRFLKSAEARKMLGSISSAKLQSLRVGGHLPAINADGLWLYDVDDIMKFINKNKINCGEASAYE
jgi:hypothetical protein